METLTWLENLSVSKWILTDEWGHPLLLSAHSIGMGIVVGIILMLDLRVLGLAPGIRMGSYRQLVGVAWGGFALNLVSGLLLFMAYATTLVGNWAFILKISLIIAGGISVWLLWGQVDRSEQSNDAFVFGSRTKIIAVVTALFWLTAIIAGRFIAYTLPEGA